MENNFKEEYLNLKDACAYFGLGRISLIKLATSADAIHRIGHKVFYNVKTMRTYIDTHKKGGGVVAKRKKDSGQPFERIGADPQFALFYKSMVTAPKWKKLSKSARLLYFYMKFEYFSKNTVEYPDNMEIFYFNESLFKHYELYTDKRQFRKDRQQLVDNGFIEVVEDNHLRRKKNIYKFSDRWKAYEEGK